MPRPLLCAFVLAAACSAPGAPPAQQQAAAAAACRAPSTLGVAYELPGDPGRQVDALTVYGWSRDGRFFAYETVDAGPGAATCEGAVRLFVVDADSDILVDGGYRELRPKHPDQEPCDPPDLRAAMAAVRAPLLAEHGIEVGHVLPPVTPIAAGELRPGVKAYTIVLPSGRTATATLEVLHGGRASAFDGKGASFELRLAAPGRSPLVLEPGVRRRPYIWDYDLDRGLVFTSPDGTHMAILTATTELSFEGDRTSWVASLLRIPGDW